MYTPCKVISLTRMGSAQRGQGAWENESAGEWEKGVGGGGGGKRADEKQALFNNAAKGTIVVPI